MANTAAAHAALKAFCEQPFGGPKVEAQPGIGIGVELFSHLVTKAIRLINGKKIQYESNTPFRGMKVSFTGTADSSRMNVTFNPIPNPPNGPSIASVQIHNLSFELSISLQQTLMSKHTVTYSQIEASFKTDAKVIGLVANRGPGAWAAEPPINLPWKNMVALPDGTAFDAAAKRDWEIQQEAFKLVTKDQFGATFVDAIEIPNVLGMIDAFEFYGPIQVSQTSDVLLLSERAKWNIDCPRREANPNLISNLAVTHRHGDTEYAVPANSPESSYPKDLQRPGENTNLGDLFVHLPQVFMQHRFDGVAKPSVTISDNGSVGPIQWQYQTAIAPANNASLVITLVNIWPTEFKISLPLQAFGSASAGVKIGCIYIEAASVGFDGSFDPFEVYFTIGLDTAREDLYFESRLGSVVAHNFRFRHSPPVGFPLDQIIDLIFGHVAESVVNGQAGAILNVTRFSLAQFGLFRGFGPMSNVLSAFSEPDKSSVTLGVTFTKA
jgi:hypothetical protein